MNTMYICQNCQELYKPPRRKNGWCKTCSNAVADAKEVIKQQLAINIAKLQEQAELDMVTAGNNALYERYQPPSTNNHLCV